MKKDSIWTPQYIALFGVNTFTAFSFYMITTLLSKYIVGIGASLATAGAVVGAFSITSLLIRPVTGYLADGYNKKKLILISSGMSAVATFGYIITGHMGIIMLFRIIHGIGFGISSTAVISLASEYIPKNKMGQGIGYFGLSQVFASAIAPGIGIMIMNYLEIKATFIIAGAIAIVSVLLIIILPYGRSNLSEKKKFEISFGRLLCTDVLHFSGISAIYSFINGVISAFLLLFAEQQGIADVSLYFTVCAVFLFLVRPFSGKIMDRKGLKIVLYPALALSFTSMLVLSRATTLSVILLSGILRSIGQGAAQPSLQAASIKVVGKDRTGVATSTYYLGGDIGQGLGPIIGGLIASAYGYSSLFVLCALMFIAGGILFFVFGGQKSGKTEI